MTGTTRMDTPARRRRLTAARGVGRASRAAPADRIVRWIGAGRRRAEAPAEAAQGPEKTAGNVVALTWAQTFGRAVRWALAEGERGRAPLRPIFRAT